MSERFDSMIDAMFAMYKQGYETIPLTQAQSDNLPETLAKFDRNGFKIIGVLKREDSGVRLYDRI